MVSGFKKRSVSPDRVAAVEAVSAQFPNTGDPRLSSMPPIASSSTETSTRPVTKDQNLGARQDSDQIQYALPSAGGGAYEVGRAYEIAVGLLKSNPMGPRAIYTSSAVDEMAMSLAKHGQLMAATGFVDADSRIVLIEGETRLRGAKAAGISTLRVEIRPRPASDRELYEQARAANVERREQTPLDDALKWRYMLEHGVYPTQISLANALKLREDHVSRILSLATLPTQIVHAVSEHATILNNQRMLISLREFWGALGDEATLDLIAEVIKNGLGYRDVVQRRIAAAKGPVRRSRAHRETLTFRGASGVLKAFEESGRLELSLKGLSPQDAQDLTEKIMSLFPRAGQT